jgi:hypothetical protein
MSNHVIHVKSCYSCQIVFFMSNHAVHVKSCSSCQIMQFMSNHVIHVNLCHSCQIMSFKKPFRSFMLSFMSFMLPFMSFISSFMFIKCVIEGIFNKVGWGVGWGVKKCFQGLRQTALLSSKGKKSMQLSRYTKLFAPSKRPHLR